MKEIGLVFLGRRYKYKSSNGNRLSLV